MAKRYIGYGITSNQGVATLDFDANGDPITGSGYTGVGAGKLDFQAELHDDSSVVSQPYTVLDCIKWDTGIDGTATNIYLENITNTVTRGLEYSTLKEPASSNVTARTSVPMQDMNIEIDIAQVDGTLTNACFVFADSNYENSSNFSLAHTGVSLGEFVHLTIEIRSGIATVKNNKNSSTVTRDLTNITTTTLYTGLWTSSDITELRFKDFKVYPV